LTKKRIDGISVEHLHTILTTVEGDEAAEASRASPTGEVANAI
jgi:hypothetical protein